MEPDTKWGLAAAPSRTSLARPTISPAPCAAGYRTLVVDLDPQGDLSDDLGYFDSDADDHGQGLAAALVTGQPVTPTLGGVRPNLDVVTGGVHLADVAAPLSLGSPAAHRPPTSSPTPSPHWSAPTTSS